MPDRRHMISRRIKGVSAYLEASLAVALSSAGLILKAPDGRAVMAMVSPITIDETSSSPSCLTTSEPGQGCSAYQMSHSGT